MLSKRATYAHYGFYLKITDSDGWRADVIHLSAIRGREALLLCLAVYESKYVVRYKLTALMDRNILYVDTTRTCD